MDVQRVGIVGSGQMGGGIAEVAARSGYEVVLRSRTIEAATATLAGIEKSLAKQVAKGKLDEADQAAIVARITPTAEIDDLFDCDLVIESVVEDITVKKVLFAELDAVCKPGAILATNTAALSVIALAMQAKRPQRVAATHLYHRDALAQLGELVRPLTA